jgi:anti-sigma regulatory factor (Ser/Thr protein kinase)
VKAHLGKLFGLHTAGKQEAYPQLPIPLTTTNLYENQKRALIGWIANLLGQKLHMDRIQAGTLIYHSFIFQDNEPAIDDENQVLLSLAARLVAWVCAEEDIYLKIKELGLADNMHRCLLETYEEVKDELPLYLTNVKVPAHSEEEKIWHVYRDVIYAVTQRKFLLIEKAEIDDYRKGKLLCEASIIERADIPKAREIAKQSLLGLGVRTTEVMSYLLVISEAVTNVLKHAREGKLSIVDAGCKLQVLVEDNGSGFPLKILPNTILMAGYSTKRSLGQGFTLMLKMTDLVLLSTVPNEGSTIILVFNREDKGGDHGVGKHSTE